MFGGSKIEQVPNVTPAEFRIAGNTLSEQDSLHDVQLFVGPRIEVRFEGQVEQPAVEKCLVTFVRQIRFDDRLERTSDPF